MLEGSIPGLSEVFTEAERFSFSGSNWEAVKSVDLSLFFDSLFWFVISVEQLLDEKNKVVVTL